MAINKKSLVTKARKTSSSTATSKSVAGKAVAPGKMVPAMKLAKQANLMTGMTRF